jgi:hypothetical protein
LLNDWWIADIPVLLDDELSAKQTEIHGLKTSVAEMTSSRAGLEASLSGTKNQLEAANTR